MGQWRVKGTGEPTASRFRPPLRLLAVTLIAVAAVQFIVQRGGTTMFANAAASSFRAPKPLIDTVAPRRTATATFAMG